MHHSLHACNHSIPVIVLYITSYFASVLFSVITLILYFCGVILLWYSCIVTSSVVIIIIFTRSATPSPYCCVFHPSTLYLYFFTKVTDPGVLSILSTVLLLILMAFCPQVIEFSPLSIYIFVCHTCIS